MFSRMAVPNTQDLLGDDAELAADRAGLEFAQVGSVVADAAGFGVIEAQQQPGQG